MSKRKPRTGRSVPPKARTAKPARKAWSGRFREQTNRAVESFTSSLSFDQRLYGYDIQGSIAHCKALELADVLPHRDASAIIRGLGEVRAEIDAGRFPFAPEDEDIHMAIERRLIELIGPVGGKLHTGRSRNDQVALDIRMYLRDALGSVLGKVKRFQRALLDQARRHLDVVMPGYTHLQRAQPVLFAHHLLAYVEMPDGFCTGSSMMPQKKNPDVPELVRGKTGRVYGHLLALLTTLKGLPLSYNRDLQEDKEALFDALDTVTASVDVYTELIKGLTVQRAAMARAASSGYVLATELADYLVVKGMPFR